MTTTIYLYLMLGIIFVLSLFMVPTLLFHRCEQCHSLNSLDAGECRKCKKKFEIEVDYSELDE